MYTNTIKQKGTNPMQMLRMIEKHITPLFIIFTLFFAGCQKANVAKLTPSPTPRTVLPTATPTTSPISAKATPTTDPVAPVAAATELYKVSNIGGCSMGDNAEFTLIKKSFITKITTWYSWGNQETVLPYQIIKDKQVIKSGALSRQDCDPYQKQWCVAGDDLINRDFEAGEYTLQLKTSKICRNAESKNKGFITVFGN